MHAKINPDYVYLLLGHLQCCSIHLQFMYLLILAAELKLLKGHSGAELHIYFLVRLESIYYQIFFYSKIVPNCAVAK